MKKENKWKYFWEELKNIFKRLFNDIKKAIKGEKK